MRVEYRELNPMLDWAWVQDRLGDFAPQPDMRTLVAYDKKTGQQLALAIFDQWTANSCFGSHVIDNPMVLRHGFWEISFEYVFVHADRAIMYALVRSDNSKSLKVTPKMGFTHKVTLEDHYEPGVHAELFRMTRDECPWIKDGQRFRRRGKLSGATSNSGYSQSAAA